MSTVNLVLANPVSSQPATLILGSSIPLFEGNQTNSSVGSVGISISAERVLTGNQTNTEVNYTPLGYFSQLSTAATAGLGTDVYWGKVELLIHANDQGQYTSQQNTSTNLIFVEQSSQDTNLVFEGAPAVIDSGPWNKTILQNGDTIVRPDIFKFGSYSMLFDGAGDYLSVPSGCILKDTIDDDWTVECWIYPSDITTKQVLFSSADTEIYIYNGMIVIDNGTTGSPATLVTNTWQHIAVACSSGIIRCYVNGVGSTPATDTKAVRNINFISCSNTQTNYYNGWMDEVRITRDIARYYTNYTVPDTQFPEGYADGGATQVNCFVGTILTRQDPSTPITGVFATGQIFGDLDESMVFPATGFQINTAVNTVTTSMNCTSAITGNSLVFSSGNVAKNLSFSIGSSLFPKTQFPDSYSTPSDANYSNVYLLLHAEGGSIVDSGPLNTTVTNINSVTLSTAQKRYGDSSLYFNKSNYLTIPGLSSGAGPITIEFSVNLTSAPTSQKTLFKIGGDNNPYWYIWIAINTDRTVSFIANLNGGYSYTTSALTLGTWYDIAISYNAAASSSAIRGFFNGSYVWGQGISNNIFLNNTGGMYIGYSPGETIGTLFNGYIDELRITKSVNRYTAAYTPGPFADSATGTILDQYYNNISLLVHGNGTNNSTTIVDNSPTPKTLTALGNTVISTSNSKFGGSSLYFDGSGDRISVPISADLQVGSGNFTIEAWIYQTTLSNVDSISTIFWYGNDGNFYNSLYFGTGINGEVHLAIYNASVGTFLTSNTGVIVPNNWHHVAGVRTGGELIIFVDGIQVAAMATNITVGIPNTGPTSEIGSYYGTTYRRGYFPGYIDDFRLTKGIARYTSGDVSATAILGPFQNTSQSVNLIGNTVPCVVGTINASVQAASIVAFGQVGNLKYERSYVINGNELTGSTGNPTLSGITGEFIQTQIGSLTSSLTESYANTVITTGQVGTLKYTREFILNGNQSNVIVGNIFGSITVGITTVIATGQVNSLNFTLTDNYGSGVITTGQVGTLKYTREYQLNGNLTIVNIGLTLPTSFSALPGNQIDSSIGTLIADRTANYAGQVTGSGQVGTILTTNVQEKSIIGFASNTNIGNISPRNTSFLTGIESTTVINSISSSLTENYSRGNQITTSVGNLTKKNDGLVQLIGNQSTISDGLILQIKYIPIVGNLITGNVRTLSIQQSLNVNCFTSVGNITTSSESSRSLTGNLSSIDVGNIRTDKFVTLTTVSLIGSVDTIATARTADYASQASTNCQVGNILTSSVRQLSITGVQTIGTTPGILFPTQTVSLTGNLISITISNITPTITANFIRGVSLTAGTGLVKAIKEYFPTGNQINTATGTIFAGPVYYRQLSGVQVTGKLYEDTQPDTNIIGTHGETYLPSSYSIKVRGSNSLITSFKCINCNSPLIEIYYNGVDAWVKLHTPGSFEDYKAYYVTDGGEYGIATDASLVPVGAEIYNIEQNKQSELIFEMTGVYDDGGPPQQFKRTYIINIIIDYSTERDLVGLGVL